MINLAVPDLTDVPLNEVTLVEADILADRIVGPKVEIVVSNNPSFSSAI